MAAKANAAAEDPTTKLKKLGEMRDALLDRHELIGDEILDRARTSALRSSDGDELAVLTSRVTDGARCFLAQQHQNVLHSLLELFGDEVEAHLAGSAPGVEPQLIAELVDIADGVATWDERHRDKQPDWSYDEEDSGQVPAERYGEHRAPQTLPD